MRFVLVLPFNWIWTPYWVSLQAHAICTACWSDRNQFRMQKEESISSSSGKSRISRFPFIRGWQAWVSHTEFKALFCQKWKLALCAFVLQSHFCLSFWQVVFKSGQVKTVIVHFFFQPREGRTTASVYLILHPCLFISLLSLNHCWEIC